MILYLVAREGPVCTSNFDLDVPIALLFALRAPWHTAWLVWLDGGLQSLVPTIACTSSNVLHTVLQAFAQVKALHSKLGCCSLNIGDFAVDGYICVCLCISVLLSISG